MEPKVNYTLVGLFVALLGTALMAGVLWLSRTDYRGVYDRYYTYMTESVSGLSADSAVKYRGVDVGRVKEIVLNPKNPEEVRIALDLVRGTPVVSTFDNSSTYSRIRPRSRPAWCSRSAFTTPRSGARLSGRQRLDEPHHAPAFGLIG